MLYWHVDDIEKVRERLVGMGATLCMSRSVTPRGEGFITAAVADPFASVLGIMYSQHCLETGCLTGGRRCILPGLAGPTHRVLRFGGVGVQR